jgi:hypothetical protein
MLIGAFFSLIAVLQTPAQLPLPASPPPPTVAPAAGDGPLDNGACMDSPRAVPLALEAPAVHSMQIVRIDKVESTQSMLQQEVIGYLYTLANGTTWLGQRAPDYMSGADAEAINRVLASTHMPGQDIKAFPPQKRYGVPIKAAQYFRVQIPPAALTGLQIELVPCVVWPPGRELPDPRL